MSLFARFFSSHKCLIYTAMGSEAYFRVAYRLKAAGVSFRTRTISDYGGHNREFFPLTDHIQYDIYVKAEDEHKALSAIFES
ncbi:MULTISPECIES: hypothetical protein [Brevibacillus]|uniref:DUF2007 domain-containing protein n=1 Tax=Brevibacillus invocatus TaxID=173959 RepID=A0A3M8CHF8_9BACL|nr:MULTISPECIES: hypothetical protein [Brevibacillus]MCM3080416.1 hypothetical protein [Brevibacillus invocatus]MCM3430662.1 hypothetical protein [Brevibacillus invocatus]MDH4618900.1 hypothetical protein [Brevibacillus sp. AY1]RNB74961.1 hypothetical protein EDM52_09605 [Brevibacillus invocatus]